jgi:hypothetical protein
VTGDTEGQPEIRSHDAAPIRLRALTARQLYGSARFPSSQGCPLAAFHNGSGVIGALIVGGLAGGATLAIGQIVFATIRTPLIRAAIGLLYAVRAAIAGCHATHGLAHIGMPYEIWRETFAIVGAVLVGGTAWCQCRLKSPQKCRLKIPHSITQPVCVEGCSLSSSRGMSVPSKALWKVNAL